jgi:hypothetical protein
MESDYAFWPKASVTCPARGGALTASITAG